METKYNLNKESKIQITADKEIDLYFMFLKEKKYRPICQNFKSLNIRNGIGLKNLILIKF